MRLSKNSKKLMLYFAKNNPIHYPEQIKKTESILLELYNDLL